jgi:hypothetical protein
VKLLLDEDQRHRYNPSLRAKKLLGALKKIARRYFRRVS